MNKVLLSILICTSVIFAKESISYAHVYVDHSEPVYEYKSNNHHHNYDRNDKYHHKENNRYRNDYRESDRYNTNRDYNTNTIGLDTIIGGTLGVIVGNQIGRGNGRTAAKIVGGVLGAAIANNSREPQYTSGYQENRNRYYNKSKSKIIVGYKNFFRYEGREHFKITNRPKKRIRVTKTISF